MNDVTICLCLFNIGIHAYNSFLPSYQKYYYVLAIYYISNENMSGSFLCHELQLR